jgi:hypothetical protein
MLSKIKLRKLNSATPSNGQKEVLLGTILAQVRRASYPFFLEKLEIYVNQS